MGSKQYDCWDLWGSKHCRGFGIRKRGNYKISEICAKCADVKNCRQSKMTKAQAKEYFLANVDGARPDDWGVVLTDE